MSVNPRFPLYIVSKGRADSRFTSKSLEEMNVPYHIVIEQQEYDAYAAVINPKKILILDETYKDRYDTFDKLGRTKSVGPGAARNFVWEHSIKQGHDWHWVMDDNINKFYRFNQNLRIPCGDGTIFKCMEDFCLRYENVGMAGPNYLSFVPRKFKRKPFITNTRIYSCNLIRNDLPHRWRGRYNEDTDLSLRMLKTKWCTIQFNAFLQNKLVTQSVQGGNTADFYAKEGTMPKSQMLVDMHPDVSKISFKYGRWHHQVDYNRFKGLKLKRKESVKIDKKIDDYGMSVIKLIKEANY